MMRIAPGLTRLLFVGGALVLTVLLYFAPRTPEPGLDVKSMTSGHAGTKKPGSEKGNYLDSSLLSLKSTIRTRVDKLVSDLGNASASDKPASIDQLVRLLDSCQKPAASAYFLQRKALQTNSKADWLASAEHFYVGSKYFPASHTLTDSAIAAFIRVMAIDPNDLKARTGLGVCYVEGTNEPMKGISLLQGVLQSDSNYVDALLNLGNFAMTSQQYAKAISRFEKVLRLKPEYILLNVRIAEAYEKLGDKPKTIEYLEKYVSKEEDPMLKTEIQNEINKLKKS
ncbi:MAG: tetratricopeptide repeat protein [Bacteroidia bacterium]